MKNIIRIRKGLLLAFLLVILSIQAKGQVGQILEMELLPEPPNNLEVANLRIYTVWSVHNNGLLSSEVSQDGNIIYVKLCYWLTLGQAITYSDDTINLGQFSAGTYNLVLDFNGINDCDSVNIVAPDTFQFQVTYGTATQITAREAGITLHPNPFTDHFTVSVAQNALHRPVSLRLYDYSGREVYYRTLDTNTAHHINTSLLPAGVYFYRMELENGQEVSGKVVKH